MKNGKKKKQQFLCSFERFMYKVCILLIVLLVVGIAAVKTFPWIRNVAFHKRLSSYEPFFLRNHSFQADIKLF